MPAPEPVGVVVDEGLGNAGYLVDLGDGRGLAVDPSVDVRAVQAEARRRGLRVAVVAETHLHADFLSGACRWADLEGATVVSGHGGGRAFGHVGLHDGEELDLGGLRLRALGTPGHTEEHTSFLLLDGQAPLGVFSGGSLLVGGTARTDLGDPARTEELARLQYRSVRRLLELPDATRLWPTHGAGSFCAAPSQTDRTSTIGRERVTGALVGVADEEAFVRRLLGSASAFPPYFRRLPELNRRGPRPDAAAPPELDVGEVERLRSQGATVVDVRPVAAFAAGHVPGALSVALRPALATWLGWLVAPDRPVVLVRDPDQDPDEVRWQAAKVGLTLSGELRGGLPAWIAAGLPVPSMRLSESPEPGADVVDVREPAEFLAGHLPGARNVPLGQLRSGVPAGARVVLACAHGERAMTGASLLEAAGRRGASVLVPAATGPSTRRVPEAAGA